MAFPTIPKLPQTPHKSLPPLIAVEGCHSGQRLGGYQPSIHNKSWIYNFCTVSQIGLFWKSIHFLFSQSPQKTRAYGCFLKWWYPTTMGFPTKNDHFGVFWGYPYFWKHPYIHALPIDRFMIMILLESWGSGEVVAAIFPPFFQAEIHRLKSTQATQGPNFSARLC